MIPDTLYILYRWGCMSLGEYLRRAHPTPHYTYDDCREWEPAEYGF